MSAKNSAKAVRKQVEKSSIVWSNIDPKWLTLYIKLNEKKIEVCDLDEVRKFLPNRKSKMGRSPTFSSYKVEEKYVWPQATD